MHFGSTSPNPPGFSPPASLPITIGSPSSSSTKSSSSSSSSSSAISRVSISPSIYGATCSFPSWPAGNSLSSTARNSAPSSFVSDEDLFPEAIDDTGFGPFLYAPPSPPREIPFIPMAKPVAPLAPLYAPEKPKKRRKSSKKNVKAVLKPMTTIPESVPSS